MCLISAWLPLLCFLYLLPFLLTLCKTVTCDFQLACSSQKASCWFLSRSLGPLRHVNPVLNTQVIITQHDAQCLQGEGVSPADVGTTSMAGWVISQRRAKGGGTTEVLDYTDSDTCLRLAISAYLPCAYLTIKRWHLYHFSLYNQ